MRLAPLFLILFIPSSSAFSYSRNNLKNWKDKKPGHPVVLVPGDGGSQLQGKLNGKPTVVHWWCDRTTSDYFDLWLNLEVFVPLSGLVDCFVDNMQLVWDNETKTTSNMPGVDVRVPGFGRTDTVEWLDSSKVNSGRYFSDIAEMLVSMGYKRGKDLIGAPYDWRKSPNELHDFFTLLKSQIESLYRWNTNKKVVIVGHSMGNPVMLYFYNKWVDQFWKDKYIQSHVSLAGPWGGSLQIVQLYASGYDLNVWELDFWETQLRTAQRTFTSSAFLFPSSAVWNKTEVLATTPLKSYTLENLKEYFDDMNYPVGYDLYKSAAFLNGDLEAPGVPIHCAYGTKVPTPESFHWQKGFPDKTPSAINGDGDGTVNVRSALVCERWKAGNNGYPVNVQEIEHADHMSILHNSEALELVRKAVYDEI